MVISLLATKRQLAFLSPAHVLEPTYEALKRRLLERHWPIGTRLEAAKLADDFGVSITPVRDSLNRLFGERMVGFVAGEGFRVPHFGEKSLRDLLAFNQILLMTAADGPPSKPFTDADTSLTVAEQTAEIFRKIAERSQNSVLSQCVTSMSDRLHGARNIECEIFEDIEHEINDLRVALKRGSTNKALLKGLLLRYHERRLNASATIVRVLNSSE